MARALEPLDEKVLLPDLLRRAPQVRPVLDRYGLRGCGGAHGPVESLEFFARAHDVPLDRLLREVRAAAGAAGANGQPAPAGDARADAIYRPFFKAGIAVVLTLGAAWGAYLLVRIALKGWAEGSFSAAGLLHEVNAHGHAQIFGWLGLFVMGFAYQAFPRFKHTALALPGWAHASFWLMAGGVVARAVLEPIAAAWPGLIDLVALASGAEVLAIAICIGVLAATWRASGKGLAFYDGYIVSALAWFLLQAVYDAAYTSATLQTTGDDLIELVKTWQGPLREIQIHGFALLMVLGVSQRVFHHFYGLPLPDRRVSLAALALLNLAVAGEAIGLLLTQGVGHTWALLWYGSGLLLAVTVFELVRSWRLWATPESTDRSLKFLRAAYVWLFLSLGLQVLLPVYQFGVLRLVAPESAAAEAGFSHAYYGAVRHAITVGFLSLMIVGVAARVVPTLNGVDVHALTGLWPTFVLINLGCALRVSGQILTDLTSAAFPVAGVSGLLEVLGLALWGAHLWAVMAGRARLRGGAEASPPLADGVPVTAGHRVGAVLAAYPETLDTFLAFGCQPLKNPVLRRTLAGQVSIGQACRLLGVDQQNLLDALNRKIQPARPGKLSLPVLEQ